MAIRSTATAYQPSPPYLRIRPAFGKRIGGNAGRSTGMRDGAVSSAYSAGAGAFQNGGNVKPNMCCAPPPGATRMFKINAKMG